jgi:hypothetical protein
MNTLLDLVRITAALSVGPLAKTINSICQAAMGFISRSAGIKTTEV